MTKWNVSDSVFMTLSGGDLVATSTNTFGGIRTDESRSAGKLVIEFTIDNATPATGGGAGFGEAASSFYADGGPSDPIAYALKNQGNSSWWMQRQNDLEQVENTGPFYDDVFTVRYYFDFDAGVFYTEVSGRVIFGGDPSTNTGGYPIVGTGPWFVQVGVIFSGAVVTLNPTPTGLPSGWSAWDSGGSTVNDLTASDLTNASPVLGSSTLNSPALIPHSLTATDFAGASPSLGTPAHVKNAPFWRFVGVSNVVTVTTTGHTLVTTGIADPLLPGDVLIACIGSRIASASSVTLPSGGEWTLVDEELTNNILTTTSAIASGTMAICVRGASDPNLAFTHPTAAAPAMGRLIVYRPVNGVAQKDTQVGSTTATNVTAVSTTGLNTALAGELLVRMLVGGQEVGWSAFDAATDPTTSSGTNSNQTADPIAGTWQERADSNTTTGNDMSLAIGDAIRATAGATGNLTATASAGAGHVSITVALILRALVRAAEFAGTAPSLGTPTLSVNSSSSHSLTAAAFAGASPALGTPALTQRHALSATAFAGATPALGPAIMSQRHALTGSAFAGAAAGIGAPALVQRQSLTATAFAGASPSIGTPAFGQRHSLTAVPHAGAAAALGTPALSLAGGIVASPFQGSAPGFTLPTLSQQHALVATAIGTGPPALTSGALSQRHALSATSFAGASPGLGTPALTQRHVLSATAFAGAAPGLGQPSVVLAGQLVSNPHAGAPPSLGTPALIQRHVLAATAFAGGAVGIGTPALVRNVVLTATAFAGLSPAFGTPAFGQVHALVATVHAGVSPDLGAPQLAQKHFLSSVSFAGQPQDLGRPDLLDIEPIIFTAVEFTSASPVLGQPYLSTIKFVPKAGRTLTGRAMRVRALANAEVRIRATSRAQPRTRGL